jgi:tetratricopeptide (TPR) repeat protein
MRLRFALAGLLLTACVHTPGPGKPPKARASYPAVTVPKGITESGYQAQRDLYGALPVATPGRQAFRALLLSHLLRRMEGELRRGLEAEALKSFTDAATLYDPAEVYRGPVREADLARAATRLIALYSPRGDAENVILPLCVEMTSGGHEARTQQRFQEIAAWIDETQQLTHGHGARGAELIRFVEKTSKVWPSAFVLETLRHLYLERKVTFAQVGGAVSLRHSRSLLPTLLQGAYFQMGYRVARMYLWVDRPEEALGHLREFSEDGQRESELRHLLEQAVSPSANVKDQTRLAEHFEDRDRDTALRICQAATERYPEQAAAYECVGRVAAALDKTHLAVASLERAVHLAPEQVALSEALAKQYQRRLFDMIGDERLEDATRLLERIEVFYRQAETRFRTRLQPGLSRLYYAIGHGLYNAGRVDLAAAAFERSVVSESSPDALVQLATIRLKRGDATGAESYLDRAEKSALASPPERIFWRGRIEALRGRALDLGGDTQRGRAAHLRSVQAWAEWQSMGLRPEARAEAYVNEAQSFYALGQKAKALDTLDRAIDVQPERKETYADVISFLATHGHLPEALDALHRALGRSEVSEYLKTYCSFWVIGLAHRAGLEPDRLAVEHLRSLSGEAWHVRLARLLLGKTSYDELLPQAKTAGNRAELHYYWADRLLAEGKVDEARDLWKKVLATDMMAFYEYEMSAFNLRGGPAAVATRPVDRQETK